MNSKYLPVWTLFHIAGIFLAAAILGQRATAFAAYSGTLLLYWVSCWITIFLFGTKTPSPLNAVETRAIFDWLPFVPIVGVAGVAISKSALFPNVPTTLLVLVAAIINGITEEWYWRRMYTSHFFPVLFRGLIFPWLIFTVFHIALLGIPDIVYEGGGLALVGGAGILGAIWGISYWLNQRYWIIAAAHASVNFFAFLMLATDNKWLIRLI
ncbi:MAG: CPBP family glutamic-type intramembrane protease [Cyanobacteria bacterium P01_F01_bin.150]